MTLPAREVPEDRPYPDRRESCQRPKSGLKPLPLGRHTSTRKTHGLPPPPVTNPTTGRKATGKEGLRPARLITRGPGSSACTWLLKGRKGPRCPQPSTSFPPLPHPRPRLEPPPREPETRSPQFITPAPDLALNRVCPAPSDHTAAFFLGVLGLYLKQNSRPRSTMASAQLPDPAQNQPPPLNAPPFSSPRLRGLRRVLARLVELRGSESCGRARRTPPRGGALTAATVEGLPPGRQRGATGKRLRLIGRRAGDWAGEFAGIGSGALEARPWLAALAWLVKGSEALLLPSARVRATGYWPLWQTCRAHCLKYRPSFFFFFPFALGEWRSECLLT